VRAAARFKCILCEKDRTPLARMKSSLPIRVRVFNFMVILDFGLIILQRPGADLIRMLVLFAIDAFTSYAAAWKLKNGSTQAAVEAFEQGWCQPFGSPHRVYHDNALALKSRGWLSWCKRHGVLVLSSATEAPWQHGAVENLIRTIRRATRATWRGLAQWPDSRPEEALRLTVQGRNELARTGSGEAPGALVFGRQVRGGMDQFNYTSVDWSPLLDGDSADAVAA